jgi:hypothetical protein
VAGVSKRRAATAAESVAVGDTMTTLVAHHLNEYAVWAELSETRLSGTGHSAS